MDRFEEYDRQGVEQALYISINAGGSGTNAAAHAAAAQFHEEHPESRMEIFIVDSHAYSMAEGAGVIEAKRRLDDGETMEAVVEYLNDKYARMEILLTAYTLKVIRKSGRISAAAAIAGDLLRHPSDFHAQRRREPYRQEGSRREGGCQRHGGDDGRAHGAGHAVLYRHIRPQI
ncbi:MAG: DegV family protein [Christensenellales bacterium]